MKKWNKWNSKYSDNKYDAIIIGSGISGLTCGSVLSNHGKRVLILEKHFKAGGWTHTFKRKNYEWDVGIHYIGEVHKLLSPTRKIFDYITDSQLEWNKMDDNYDRIIFPDQAYNFTAPYTRFVDDMVEYFPGRRDQFEKYISLINESVKSGLPFFANKALPNWLSYFTYKKMSNPFHKYSDVSTKEVIMNIFNDEIILGVLTGQWGDHGLPPNQSSFAMHAMVVRHYLDGGNYPVGTSRRIAETVTDSIEKNGGDVFVNAGVKKIITKGNKAIGVLLDNGDEVFGTTIISSAGVFNTFNKMLPSSFKNNRLQNKLNTVIPTFSYHSLHIGIKKSFSEFQTTNTNLWIYPGYNHDKNVDDYLNNQSKNFPLLYISFPSAKDPSATQKNPNFSTIEAITVANWDSFSKWKEQPWKKRGDEYNRYKKQITNNILETVYKYIPKLNSSVDYHELSTPLTVRSLANYSVGEMYGISHEPNRFRQKWLRPETDIKNLYLTGQDILTVGVTSAMFSGIITTSAVLRKNIFKKILGS